VWCRLALCVVLGGCGFHSRSGALPPDGDGSGSDGSGSDGSGSGSDGAAADCLQRWLGSAPDLAFSTPQELTALGATGDENRDPWISANGLELYFSRSGPGTAHGGDDVYLATRDSTAMDFPMTMVKPVDNLDSPDDEDRVALNGDETILVMSSNHGTSGNRFQIMVSTRTDVTKSFPSPSGSVQDLVAAVNTNDNYYDPFLTQDGLTLYVAPSIAPAPQQIRMATRTAGGNFGASTLVPVINSGTSIDADPTLSLDQRIIVFSSTRNPMVAGMGATNLWYATRSGATGDFSAPKLIPMVNSDQDDGDPVLSADGCELYFASTRDGGKYQLFHARMTQ
jgi:hypothetical protein